MSNSAFRAGIADVTSTLVSGPRFLSAILVGLAVVGAVANFTPPAGSAERPLVVAVTGTVRESGLLATLVPSFEQKAGVTVKIITAAPDALFMLGRRGEADALLVDAPPEGEGPLEDLVSSGRTAGVRAVMHSPILIVGPPQDPAKVSGLGPAKAFAAVAKARAPFVSRGDRSAIHQVELAIWERASIAPRSWPGYREARKEMDAALRLAASTKAYAVTDQATYLRLRDTLALTVFVQNFKILRTSYSFVEMTPLAQRPGRPKEAHAFGEFLVSSEAQGVIKTFGADRYGQPLFLPETED